MSLAARLASLARPMRALPRRPLTTIAWANGTDASAAAHPAPAAAAVPASRPSHIIMSVAGRDSAGIVNRVISTVTSHNANVEESRMATLGGDFAMIVYISAPADVTPDVLAPQLRAELPDFSVSMHATTPPAAPDTGAHIWAFSLEGPDQPGILAAVSQALATNGCNVLEMQTETAPTPFSGGETFRMDGLVGLNEAKIEQLSDALTNVENRFGMSIVLNQK